jgi:hypothetical protein
MTFPIISNPDDRFEVTNTDTGESHGTYPTLEQARGCVRFDKLRVYSIWQGHVEDGEFVADHRREEACDGDPENIYGLASIRQSIEEDRRR